MSFLDGLKNVFWVVGLTIFLVTPLVTGLFPPSKDQNLSPGSALSGPLFRFASSQADGPPEAIDSLVSSNVLLYSFQ